MLNRLISNDQPRSRLLSAVLILILLGLAFAPFLFPGVKALSVAAKVLIFVVLVVGFDLLLGYTGIVSFAHTMFFGIGAYGIAISSNTWGPTWGAIGLGFALSLGITLVFSLLIGLFSLRVRAIFFAMITLAVAAAFQTLASQLSDFTGGEDGLSFKVPELLSPGTEFSDEPLFGVSLDGRLLSYYLLFVLALGMLLAMLRIVNSPFGRVLQAIRENEFRAEAIGYRVVVYRTLSSVLSASFACVAGAMLALWLRYNGRRLVRSCFCWRKAICKTCCAWPVRRLRPGLCCRPCCRPTAGCCGWACCLCCRCTTFPQAWWGACAPALP